VSPERFLMLITPVMTMAMVTVGMRMGADTPMRAAVLFGAPASGAGTGLAWQVVTFDEDHGMREPVAVPDVEVAVRSEGREAHWRGATNIDGAAEMLLPLQDANHVRVDVRAGGAPLAVGDAEVPVPAAHAAATTSWTRFTRREGNIVLDVAILGQRVASGFPASIWVRATDATTRAALARVVVELEQDASLSSALGSVRTDERGWAHVTATPMGHAVSMTLHARTAGDKTGLWAGALIVSPGAAQLSVRDRYSSEEEPAFDLVMPNVRATGYVEIDNARGRAWAAAGPWATSDGGPPRAVLRAPRLAPGLYWAVASSDPAAGALLGPGTLARAFFVAASDEQALSFGTDSEECAPPHDPRELVRAVSVCASLASPVPVPRRMLLDGFAAQRALQAHKRRRGFGVALGAIAMSILLETVLLLRAAHQARLRLRALAAGESEFSDAQVARAGKLGIALLVAMLGFVLLAAFLAKAG
jgi:hypothetical protein